MAATFQLRLLGPIQVTREGKAVHGFESRKAIALLGYLAARGQPVSRTQLADLLWSDKTESQGRANLSRVLHNLSTLLPGSFQSDHHAIEFNLAPHHWLDLRAFEDLATTGTADALTSAAHLYRDDFMAGIYLDDCPDFEIWLVAQREHWRRRAVEVLAGLVNHHGGHGDYEAARQFALRWIALEPWREEAHAQVMTLLARTGQRSAALSQYETAKQVLAQELGIEPSGELATLYERIKAGELQPKIEQPTSLAQPFTPADNLPVQLTSFIGRDGEIADILEHLQNPACRLLTIVGAPGAGKTRLAVEAGAKLLGVFANGVYFVPLASVGDPRFLVPAIIQALEFSPAGSSEPRLQLLNYLREKHLLLVLDSFEHLLEGADLVTEILQKAPAVKILITSQERLNLRAEWLLYVEGLKFPRMNGTEPITGYAAVKLLLDRAHSVETHFNLSSEVQPAVIRICQLVEGLPLGLELAAAWVGKFSCAYIAQEIERNLDFLGTSLRDVPARHRSLRAALDWSYNLLREPERVLLRRLSVFGGGLSLDAALRICDLGDLHQDTSKDSRTEMLRMLNLLIDKSLLRTDATREPDPRFMLLEPIREFAQQRLAESGEEEIIRERHAEYFLELVESAEARFRTAERDAWLARLEVEYDNLRAALQWSLAETARLQIAERLTATLVWYWYFRSQLDEGRAWVERVLAGTEVSLPTRARVRLLYGAGMGAWLQSNYALARTYLAESLRFARALDDKASTAYALTFLGLVAMNQGDPAEARLRHEESGALFSEIGDRWGFALSLTNLELVASLQGDAAAGRAAIEQAVRIFGELRDRWGESLALNNLGLFAYRQGDLTAARARLEQALAIRREVGDKWLIAQSLNYLGNVALAQRDDLEAYASLKESMLLNRELGNKHGISELLSGFAARAAARGEPQRAARLFGAAEALREAIGSPVPLPDRAEYDRVVAAARSQLDAAAWAREWQEGQKLVLEEAIKLALEKPPPP
jgi:predicted ATPase/DNA-binding SARP family transcriptional activator